jgi:hypothetical protein
LGSGSGSGRARVKKTFLVKKLSAISTIDLSLGSAATCKIKYAWDGSLVCILCIFILVARQRGHLHAGRVATTALLGAVASG